VLLVKRGKKYCVRYSGTEGKEYDYVWDFAMSPDGSRLAYTARDKEEFFVVVDGKKYGGYLDVGDGLTFSPDGSRWIFTGLKESYYSRNPVVVIDGKERTYDGVLGPIPDHFSPVGNRVVYIARDGKKSFIVDNLEKGRKYERTALGPIFSADGSKLAFSAYRHDTAFLVINGEEYGGYTTVTDLCISEDGLHHACAVTMNYDAFAVSDGKLFGPYEEVYNPRFSPFDNRFAFVARVSDTSFALILDGEQHEEYMDVVNVTFSESTSDYAYMAILDTISHQQAVVHNHERHKVYNYVYYNHLQFTQPGNHLSYIAEIDTSRIVAVIDGVESKEYNQIHSIIFSPDGNERTLRTQVEDSLWCVVRNGLVGPAFESIMSQVYSSDSRHLAYYALKDGLWHLVVDDQVFEGFTRMGPLVPSFGPDNVISYFGEKDAKYIYKVTVAPQEL